MPVHLRNPNRTVEVGGPVSVTTRARRLGLHRRSVLAGAAVE